MAMPNCSCCDAKATVMRRKIVLDKPAETRWYCKVHAPAPEIPASEFKPFESYFKPLSMETRQHGD